jgi:hypothetical protein
MDEGGSRDWASLSLSRGSLRRASMEGFLMGSLEDMLRKFLDTGISLHRSHFISVENHESGGGGELVYWEL